MQEELIAWASVPTGAESFPFPATTAMVIEYSDEILAYDMDQKLVARYAAPEIVPTLRRHLAESPFWFQVDSSDYDAAWLRVRTAYSDSQVVCCEQFLRGAPMFLLLDRSNRRTLLEVYPASALNHVPQVLVQVLWIDQPRLGALQHAVDIADQLLRRDNVPTA